MFLDTLKQGVKRTTDLIARATEFHGGAVTTEYLLTADIAREFIERGFEVQVECLNKTLVNGMTAKKKTNPNKILGSRRTDVAIVSNGIVPRALIEVKIGVSKITRIKIDLDKITTTMNMMKAKYAKNNIGAAVFQTHIKRRKWLHKNQFKEATEKLENKIKFELENYAKTKQDFAFTMHPLQGSNEGIAGRAIEGIGEDAAWAEYGHATRYHAILIRSMRTVSPPPQNFQQLKAQYQE